MLQLLNIRSRLDADGGFTFMLELRDMLGTCQVEVQPVELLGYFTTQLKILLTTGRMWSLPACEGRSAEAASAEWKFTVAALLEQAAVSNKQQAQN